MSSLIATLVDRPGHAIGALIEPHPTYTRRQRWELPALITLLILAAIVRFWGVGSFSLHKPDEDTTALPAVHILVDGTPRFPSGMFYGRAIVQSYLIAGSVKAFGQTEWALRLPSVLAGILVVMLAYFLGRRFLDPVWNAVFVGVVALLPGMIADSQEARMYIFLSASLAAYMVLLFRWERNGHTAALVGAVVAMLIAIQFQEIALFSAALVLFPGLANSNVRKLRSGLLALLAIGLGYLLISSWVSYFYPHMPKDLPTVSQTGAAPSAGALRSQIWPLLMATLMGAALVWSIVRTMTLRYAAGISGALVFLGLLAQSLLFYHLAALLLVAGLVIARRHGGARPVSVFVLVIVSAALAVLHILMLHKAGIGPPRKVVGVMVGQPSIWPYLQVAAYSPVAMLVTAGSVAIGLWHIAHGSRARDFVLFAVLGVFVPLLVIGCFGWYIPPRYGEFALLPMLLCAMSAARNFLVSRSCMSVPRTALVSVLVAVVCGVAIVNPRAVAYSVNAGATFADHRGAAAFVRAAGPGPRDIIVAEEVLMQTYYLGHVDYWLTGLRNASAFVYRVNDELVDTYTATPVIFSAATFRALVDRPDRGAIYVIGSGENQQDGRLYLRGPEINALLQSPELKAVYVAPDGRTKVWKVSPPAVDAGE